MDGMPKVSDGGGCLEGQGVKHPVMAKDSDRFSLHVSNAVER